MHAEHLHLALNHLPFLGAGFALIPLLIGAATRSRATVIAGLLVAALAGWTTPLVMATGEGAYDRYEKGPVARYLDPQAEHYLEIHEERAEAWVAVFYGMAVLATAGMVLVAKRPQWVSSVGYALAVVCALAVGAGIWIAESGGKIRRPDFRTSTPAQLTSPSHLEREHEEE